VSLTINPDSQYSCPSSLEIMFNKFWVVFQGLGHVDVLQSPQSYRKQRLRSGWAKELELDVTMLAQT
jgi:hypothetical protein